MEEVGWRRRSVVVVRARRLSMVFFSDINLIKGRQAVLP
jgi:hypothetical protein